MDAKEIIINLIRNKVAVMNICMRNNNAEAFERFRHELTGMLICLKNIEAGDKFYSINYNDDCIEFGFYDEIGKWISIKK